MRRSARRFDETRLPPRQDGAMSIPVEDVAAPAKVRELARGAALVPVWRNELGGPAPPRAGGRSPPRARRFGGGGPGPAGGPPPPPRPGLPAAPPPWRPA